MKSFKYLVFLSILGGVFIGVYRQSDKAGLIPVGVQASENDFPR